MSTKRMGDGMQPGAKVYQVGAAKTGTLDGQQQTAPLAPALNPAELSAAHQLHGLPADNANTIAAQQVARHQKG